MIRVRSHSAFPPDMIIVQNFTLPDFHAKTFTPSVSPNFNSFSDRTQKMGENRESYTAGKNFTLPPSVMGGTNITSAPPQTEVLLMER